MKSKYPSLSMDLLCGLFGYTRQNYYKSCSRFKNRFDFEEQVLGIIKQIRKEQSRIGTIKLHYLVNLELPGQSIGRDRLYNLLRSKGMLIRRRKKYRPKMTDGNGKSLYPDLRKGFEVSRINQLWCSDITYIELNTVQRHCYLICVTDEYSHLISGYCIDLHMRTIEVLKAMKMAVKSQLKKGQKTFTNPLIIHSDRGSQYKSARFQAYTKAHNILCSMTAAGKSYENPVAERLNGILKNELLTKNSFDSFEEAKQAIDIAIKIYNEKRPHLSCNLLTPKQAHQAQDLPLKKLWRQRKAK